MAGSRELKNRIEGVKNTRKITNAMYLISSTKLKKARKSMEDIEPYFYGIQNLMHRMMRHFPDIIHPYIAGPNSNISEEEKTHGFLVITGDKGLAGSYNINVLKETVEAMGKNKARIFVIGEAGRRYFEQRGIEIEKHFKYTAQNPTRGRAREIAVSFLSQYDKGEIDDLSVVFTAMKNSLEDETRIVKILPLEFPASAIAVPSDVPQEEFFMHPSPQEVVESIIPPYVAGLVYSTMVESYCAEQNSRMQAMSAANDSADEIIQNLRIKYNRERQGVITQEITEVSAGARSKRG